MNPLHEYFHKQVSLPQFQLIMYYAKELHTFQDKFQVCENIIDGFQTRVRFTDRTLHVEVYKDKNETFNRCIFQFTDVGSEPYNMKETDLQFYSRGLQWSGNIFRTNKIAVDTDIATNNIITYPPDEASYFQRSLVEELPDVSLLHHWYNMMETAPPNLAVYCVGFMVPEMYTLSLHNVFDEAIRALNELSNLCTGLGHIDPTEKWKTTIY